MVDSPTPDPAPGRAGPRPRSATPTVDRAPPTHELCPLLLAERGAWRRSSPAREHRCAALGDDAPLALDKQQRLCLTPAHRSCQTFQVATEPPAGDEGAPRPYATHRPYPRMAPVVLDHGRLGTPIQRINVDRASGQLALGGLMGLAFLAIAIARLGGVGDSGIAAGAASPSPSASSAMASPTARPTNRETPSAPPPSTAPSPTIAPSPVATPPPTAPPTPTAVPTPARTYTVQAGDTLSVIAERFGTTVAVLAELNGIDDPSRIGIGQVLTLP